MATATQIFANRENSKFSTGPRTPEGKAASSPNAKTHGLSAADPVLPHEDRNQFNALLGCYQFDFAPTTAHEQFLVCQMAGARWKLDRAERIEVAMFAVLESPNDPATTEALMAQASLGKDTATGFARLDRYRASLERTYHRCARELRATRKEHGLAPARLRIPAQARPNQPKRRKQGGERRARLKTWRRRSPFVVCVAPRSKKPRRPNEKGMRHRASCARSPETDSWLLAPDS